MLNVGFIIESRDFNNNDLYSKYHNAHYSTVSINSFDGTDCASWTNTRIRVILHDYTMLRRIFIILVEQQNLNKHRIRV